MAPSKKKLKLSSEARKVKPPSTWSGRGLTAHRQVLHVLARLALSNGVQAVSRKLVGLLIYQECCGTVDNKITALKNEGFVEYPPVSGTIRINEAGLLEAGTVMPYTTEELHECFRSLLTGPEKEVYDILRDGQAHDYETVRVTVGKETPNFGNIVGGISGLSILERLMVGGTKSIQLTDLIFPLGRPDAPDNRIDADDDDGSVVAV